MLNKCSAHFFFNKVNRKFSQNIVNLCSDNSSTLTSKVSLGLLLFIDNYVYRMLIISFCRCIYNLNIATK